MTKIFIVLISFSLCLLAPLSFAEEASVVSDSTNVEVVEKNQKAIKPLPVEKVPEVGKHVLANMDSGSMILSLLIALLLWA